MERGQAFTNLMGNRMLVLNNSPRAARLQATFLALVSLGLFSPPFTGIEVPTDLLGILSVRIGNTLSLPLKTLDECVNAFEFAINAFESSKNENPGLELAGLIGLLLQSYRTE